MMDFNTPNFITRKLPILISPFEKNMLFFRYGLMIIFINFFIHFRKESRLNVFKSHSYNQVEVIFFEYEIRRRASAPDGKDGNFLMDFYNNFSC